MRAESFSSNFDTGKCICVDTGYVASHIHLLWIATLSCLPLHLRIEKKSAADIDLLLV